MIKAIAAIRFGDGALGYKNKLIYSDKGDMDRFKRLTLEAQVLLMGSNTAKSLKRPLPGRSCVVCTNNPSKQKSLFDAGFDIISGKFIGELIDEYKGHPTKHLMIIGGGVLYNSMLEHIELFHLTMIGMPHHPLYEKISKLPSDSFLDNFFSNEDVWKLEWSGVSLTNREVIYYDYTRRKTTDYDVRV